MCCFLGRVAVPVEIQNGFKGEIKMAARPIADKTDGVVAIVIGVVALQHYIGVLFQHQVSHRIAKPASNITQV